MKICHVTSAHKTDDVRIFHKECASLATDSDKQVFLVGEGESRNEKNVIVIGVGKKPSSRIKRMLWFSKRIVNAALEIDADIYHLHDPELLRHALTLINNGKKVIFDSHENTLNSIDEKKYIPKPLRNVIKKYYENLEKRVLKKVNAIVVVTPQMIDGYKDYNDNISVIPNYPIIDNISNINDNITVKRRFFFAGGITEQWSHREIINAIENIDDVEYHLYGKANDEYLESLKKLNGWGKVRYFGQVSFNTVQSEMAKAQFTFALLKPGKNTYGNEGTLGNTKLFESISHGIPVIATNFELWEKIIINHNCGICADPNKKEDIEAKIIAMLNKSEEEIQSMKNNGYKITKEQYSWQSVSKDLFTLYSTI